MRFNEIWSCGWDKTIQTVYGLISRKKVQERYLMNAAVWLRSCKIIE